jgi:hypothetical protein
MNAENTQLKSADYYKNKKFIKENFADDKGNFNEAKFDNFYSAAAERYNQFAAGFSDKDEFSKFRLIEQEYNNAMRYGESTKFKQHKFEVEKARNPFQTLIGVQGVGTITESNLSTAEIAQQGRVIDYETGKTLDWSANDKGGFLKGLIREPLVLAQWDEDGEHEEDGRMVQHKAGQFKLNEDGEICYETLGNRDASRKHFLSYFDTITVDGSFANKFDFLDADDKEQSIKGAIARAALKYAPVALGAMATGGILPLMSNIYLGATAAISLAEALPSHMKAIEGILDGKDSGIADVENKSGIWKAMNRLQAYTKPFTFGTSEFSQKEMFTWENIIKTIGDVSIQLGQQQLVAKIPQYLGLDKKALKGVTDAREIAQKRAKFGQFQRDLGSFYMTLTSTADAYGAAKDYGHTDRMAGLIALGTLIGTHKIVKSEIGQYPLRGIGLDETSLAMRPSIQRIVREVSEKAGEGFSKQTNKQVIKDIYKRVSGLAGKIMESPNSLAAAAANEAIEELGEEMVADFFQALGAGASALGLTKEVNYQYDIGQATDRYLMAMLGGAIGGGIHKLRFPWQQTHKALDSYDLADLTYFYDADTVKKIIRKTEIPGSKTLSASKIDLKSNSFLDAENEADTQQNFIRERLCDVVDAYEHIYKNVGIENFDLETRKALLNESDPVLKSLKDFGLENRVGNDLADYNHKIISLWSKKSDEEGNEDLNAKLDEQINQLMAERTNITKGLKADNYVQQTMLYLDKPFAEIFMTVDKKDFARKMFNVDYDTLGELDKALMDSRYADYNGEAGGKIRQYEFAVKMMEEANKKLGKYAEKYPNYKPIKDKVKEVFKTELENMYGNLETLNNGQQQITFGQVDLIDANGEQNLTVRNDILTNNEGIFQFLNLDMQNLENSKLKILQTLNDLSQGGLPIDGEIMAEIKPVLNLYRDNQLKRVKSLNSPFLTLTMDPSFKPIQSLTDQGIRDAEKAIKEYTDNLSGDEDFITDPEGVFSTLPVDATTKEIQKAVYDYMVNYLNKITDLDKSNANFIENLQVAIESSVKNPIYEYLEDITGLTNSNNNGIIELLAEESIKAKESKLDDYFLNDPEKYDAIKKDIKIASALLDSLQDNGRGYYPVLNKFREKFKTGDIVNLIEANNAQSMKRNLNELEQKIDFFYGLSLYNQGDRFREQKNIKLKFFELFTGELDPDENSLSILSKARIFKGVDLLDGVPQLHEQLANINQQIKVAKESGQSTDQLSIKQEALLTEIESLIYNNFTKLSEEDRIRYLEFILDEKNGIINLDEVANLRTSDLSSRDDNTLTNYDKVVYLISVLSADAKDFKFYLREALNEKDGEGNLTYNYSPTFAQEYPIKIAYAGIKNNSLFNKFVDVLQSKNTSANTARSTIFIEGYHGVGKTSATANLLNKIIKLDTGSDVLATSIKERQSRNIANSLGLTDFKTKDQLWSLIFGDTKVDDLVNKDGSIKTSEIDKFVNDELANVVFIDEVTWYDSQELSVLSKWIENTGRNLVVLGDSLQEGAPKNISAMNVIKSPIIEYSMRSGSLVQKHNADTVRALSKTMHYLQVGDVSSQIRNILAEAKKWNQDIVLKNIQTENLFRGCKMGQTADDVKAFIDFLKKNGTDMKSVAIIYDEESDYLFDQIKDYNPDIIKIKRDEVQGSEFDYVICTSDIKNPSTDLRADNGLTSAREFLSYTKKINTLLSRAKFGTIFTGKNDFTVQQVERDTNLVFDKDKSQEFRDVRIKALDESLGEYKPEKAEVKTEETTTEDRKGEGKERLPNKTELEVSNELGETKGVTLDQPIEAQERGACTFNKKAHGYTQFSNFGFKHNITYDENGQLVLNITKQPSKSQINKKFYLDLSNYLDKTVYTGNEAETMRLKMKDYEAKRKFIIDQMINSDMKQSELDAFLKEQIKEIKDLKLGDSFDGVYDGVEVLLTDKTDADLNCEAGSQDTVKVGDKMIRIAIKLKNGNFNPSTGKTVETKPTYIVLATVNQEEFKNQNSTMFASMEQDLKKNGFATRKVSADAFRPAGIHTYIMPKTGARVSLREYMDSPEYKVISKPYIFTGKDDHLKSITESGSFAEIREKLEAYQGLNGRPVVFISKRAKGNEASEMDIDKMALDFINDRIDNKTNTEVNMVVLQPNSYKKFSDFRNAYMKEIVSIRAFDNKAEKAKRLDSFASKYMGLSILEEIYAFKAAMDQFGAKTLRYAKKESMSWEQKVKTLKDTLNNAGINVTEAEAKQLMFDYNTIDDICSFMSKIYFLDYKNINGNYVVTYKGEDRTAEMVINGELDKNKKERSVLYDKYYSAENCYGFDFVSILSTLCSIARPSKADHANQQCFESYVAAIKKRIDETGETIIKENFFDEAKNLQYWLPALDRVLSTDNKVRTSRFYGEGKGFQYRPTFKGKGNSDTNYVEFADENGGLIYDNLYINDAIVCSQRFHLDLENGVLTDVQYAEKKANENKILEQKKEQLRNSILLQLPLLSEADNKNIENSFQTKPYEEFVKDVEKIIKNSANIKNDLSIYKAEVKNGTLVIESMVQHLTNTGLIDPQINFANKKVVYKDSEGNEYSADLNSNGKISNAVITKPKDTEEKKPVVDEKKEVDFDNKEALNIFNNVYKTSDFEEVIYNRIDDLYLNSEYNIEQLTDDLLKQTKIDLRDEIISEMREEINRKGLSQDLINSDVINKIDEFINNSVDDLLNNFKSEKARHKRLGDETEQHILNKYSGFINAAIDQALGDATLDENFLKNIDKITETITNEILETKFSAEDSRTLGKVITDEMIAISKNYQDDTYVLDEAIYDSVYAFIHTNLENKTERGKMYQNILVNLQNAKTFNDVKSLYEEALRIGKENDFEIEVENKLKELC